MRSFLPAGLLRYGAMAIALILPAAMAFGQSLKDPPERALDEFRRPELVAISWATGHISPARAAGQPAWRPDGTLLDAEELAWIEKDLPMFRRATWNPEYQHRPLVFLFRLEERPTEHQFVGATLRFGDREILSRQSHAPSKNYLSACACTPLKSDFSEWPREVDIDVQWRLEKPQLIRTVAGMPKGVITIDPGVTWSTEGEACVLQIAESTADPLVKYQFLTHFEQGGSDIAYSALAAGRRPPDANRKFSRPVDPENPLKSTDFYRIRYRRERLQKIPTFPNLMLK